MSYKFSTISNIFFFLFKYFIFKIPSSKVSVFYIAGIPLYLHIGIREPGVNLPNLVGVVSKK